jgi:hypothetical protein
MDKEETGQSVYGLSFFIAGKDSFHYQEFYFHFSKKPTIISLDEKIECIERNGGHS